MNPLTNSRYFLPSIQPFIWLSVVPKEYFKLQRQRQPLALLIFAYFGALLEQLHRDWWTDSCGKSIVGVVDDCLGSYWAEWMEWPKQAVNQRQQQQQNTES
jgi:predicted alpha/beta hydrolase